MGDAFLALLEGQSHQLVYCTVRESKHRVIYVVRVQDEILEPFELENMRSSCATSSPPAGN